MIRKLFGKILYILFALSGGHWSDNTESSVLLLHHQKEFTNSNDVAERQDKLAFFFNDV